MIIDCFLYMIVQIGDDKSHHCTTSDVDNDVSICDDYDDLIISEDLDVDMIMMILMMITMMILI